MTESAERLLSWVNDNGGASEVAKNAGLDRQVFHSLKTKGIDPSLPTLKKIHKAYSSLDIHWVGTGEERQGVVYPVVERSFVESENERLKLQNEKLQEELAEVKGEKKKLFDLLGKAEGTQQSLLVDTEEGAKEMAAIFGTQVLRTLFEETKKV